MSAAFVLALALTACTGVETQPGKDAPAGDDANHKPEVTITSHAAGDAVTEGSTITLTGSASDEETANGELMAGWYSGARELCASAPLAEDGVSSCEAEIALRDAVITFRVIDPENFIGSAEIELDVVETATPTIEIVSPTAAGSYSSGTPVTFEVTVSDGEDAPRELVVAWADSEDTLELPSQPDASGTVSGDFLASAGVHQFVAVVTDTDGKSSRAYGEYTVEAGNAAPTVVITAPAEATLISVGDTLDFTGTVSDDATAADVLTLTWEDSIDGVLNVAAADAAGSAGFTASGLAPGAHVMTLSASDAEGSVGSATVAFTVNGLPDAPVVSISPATPGTADELTAVIDVESTDAEGDAITYTYAWTVNGAASSEIGASIAADLTTRGDVWEVAVSPNDGIGSGPAGSASVTIGNSAPVLTNVALGPDPAYEGNTLTCTPGSSSDADGNTVTFAYAWMVNGVATADTAATLGSSAWSKNDTVQCAATPMDDAMSGAAVSSSIVTIGNTAPTAPVVAVSPTDPEEGLDDVVCSVEVASTDADAGIDTVVYVFSWTVDGAAFAGATDAATTSTVDASETAEGEVWVCSAMASDGTASSAAGSDSVTCLGPSYTIGYDDEYAQTGTEAINYLFAEAVTLDSAVELYALGNIGKVASGDIKFALYADDAGAPGALVASTASAATVVGALELDVVGAPVAVAAGEYWLVWACGTSACRTAYTTSEVSSNVLYYKVADFTTAFPFTFGVATSLTGQAYNIYGVVR